MPRAGGAAPPGPGSIACTSFRCRTDSRHFVQFWPSLPRPRRIRGPRGRDKFFARRVGRSRAGDRRRNPCIPVCSLRPRSSRLQAVRPRTNLLPGRMPPHLSARIVAAIGGQVPALASRRTQARCTAIAITGQVLGAESDAAGIPDRAGPGHVRLADGRVHRRRRGGLPWRNGRPRFAWIRISGCS